MMRLLRPWLGLILVCGGFSLHPGFLHTFWSADYLPTILQQAATNIILATGMTFVILTAGIDLSVGSVVALCGITLGLTVKGGLPAFLAVLSAFPVGVAAALAGWRYFRISGAVVAGLGATGGIGWLFYHAAAAGTRLEWAVLAALSVGLGCGLLNGLVVTVGRVPPFITTLGMLTAARGLTVFATDGNSVSGLPARLGYVGEGAPLVAVALVAVVAGSLLLNRTRAGRYMLAIGANEEASRLSGVGVGWYKVLAYALCGLSAAVAGIVLTAKFQLADTGAGTGAELNAIAAVVLGGTSLSGGQGTVVGSLIGALTIAVLNSGLVLVGVKDTLQGVVIGAVIVVTVVVDQYTRQRARQA